MNKEKITELARKHGTSYTNRHLLGEPAIGFANKSWDAFCNALVATQPNSVDAVAVLQEFIDAFDELISQGGRSIVIDAKVSVWVSRARETIAQQVQPALVKANLRPDPNAYPVPLTDEQVQTLIHTTHFREGYMLERSDKILLDWYLMGLRNGEAAHGIVVRKWGA